MLIIKESTGKVLAKSDLDLISLGREEDNTVPLDVESVSGYHGIFLNVQGTWVYRDNFSTNGSFFNGNALRFGQARVVKNGDLIRLANYQIQCELKNERELKNNIVLVLKGFDAVSSFSLPDFSSTLIIDSAIVPEYNNTNFTIVRSQEGVLSLTSEQEIAVNTKPHTGKITLIDQDQVDVGEYTFLICNTSIAVKASRNVPERNEYDPSKKLAESGKRVVFGGANTEQTQEKKSGGFRAEMSMSQKLATIADDEATKQKNKVERAYAIFGVVVLFTTLIFFSSLISLFR